METLLDESTIIATSFGYEIPRDADFFSVLFKALDGTNIGHVVGMMIPSGKDALKAYNRMFKGRQFCITMNVKGNLCEGMRWDHDKWTAVPKPTEQVFLQTTNGFEVTDSYESQCWDTRSQGWVMKTSIVKTPLYRLAGTDGPFNCFGCKSISEECTCSGINGLRQSIIGNRKIIVFEDTSKFETESSSEEISSDDDFDDYDCSRQKAKELKSHGIRCRPW